MSEESERRMRTRIPARIALGFVIGIALGVAMGAIASAIPSTPPALGLWVIVIACATFGGLVGALIGGYASLESPNPGREPSDTERPIVDRPGLVREEHPGPSTPGTTPDREGSDR